MMQSIQTSSYNQKNFFSFFFNEQQNSYCKENERILINHKTLFQHENPMLSSINDVSSEFLQSNRHESNKEFLIPIEDNINKVLLQNGLDQQLLSESTGFIYDKPLQDLENKIQQIYDENQEENWDGYGAKPVQNLSQALVFAEDLFLESQFLVKAVDITPENDGSICFEWFISNNRHISVAVKNDKLIHHSQIGEETDCGEKSFSGSKKLIRQIREVTGL